MQHMQDRYAEYANLPVYSVVIRGDGKRTVWDLPYPAAGIIALYHVSFMEGVMHPIATDGYEAKPTLGDKQFTLEPALEYGVAIQVDYWAKS